MNELGSLGLFQTRQICVLGPRDDQGYIKTVNRGHWLNRDDEGGKGAEKMKFPHELVASRKIGFLNQDDAIDRLNERTSMPWRHPRLRMLKAQRKNHEE